MQIYVHSIILPLMVPTNDTDCILCVAQAEAKETTGHENITIECD
jgi:hypothetical protein